MSKRGTRKGIPNKRKMTKTQVVARAKSYKQKIMKSDFLIERVVSAKCPRCEAMHFVKETVPMGASVRLRRVYCRVRGQTAYDTDNENIFSIGYGDR